MSGDVVIDSVILIDHFNSVSQATACLSEVGDGGNHGHHPRQGIDGV